MNIYLGILFGVIVSCFWGLAFLVPYAIPSLDPFLITLGRFGTYGILSVFLILSRSKPVLRELHVRDWLWAFALAFTGNLGYYVVLVTAIHLAGAAVAALIVGALPVTMALYGNWKQRELDLRRLLLPLALILGGLISLNGYKLATVTTIGTREDLVIGILCAVIALGLWTWYGVQNSRYMIRRVQISSEAWSTVVGVSTLILLLGALPVLEITGVWSPVAALESVQSRGAIMTFFAASLLLGIVVSWFATVLWNIAARRLPVSLAAQLIVFETVSSILYASLVDHRPPPVFEVIFMIITLTGVLLGIRTILQGGSPAKASKPMVHQAQRAASTADD